MSEPTHTLLSVQEFLTKFGLTPMPHPPYSPNLAPGNLFFVSQVKKVLKGKWLADVKEVKHKMTEALKGINKFKNCI